jgi:hypothetical protein
MINLTRITHIMPMSACSMFTHTARSARRLALGDPQGRDHEEPRRTDVRTPRGPRASWRWH